MDNISCTLCCFLFLTTLLTTLSLCPLQKNNAKNFVNSCKQHWILKACPLDCLITDRGREYFNFDVQNLFTVFQPNNPTTQLNPLTNGLTEVQNSKTGTHLRQNYETNSSL